MHKATNPTTLKYKSKATFAENEICSDSEYENNNETSFESEGEETPKPLISKKEKAKKEKLGVEVDESIGDVREKAKRRKMKDRKDKKKQNSKSSKKMKKDPLPYVKHYFDDILTTSPLCKTFHETITLHFQILDRINQTEYNLVRDLSILGNLVYLEVPRRQFHCKSAKSI